jgi:CheY-like chemotaxis protein
MSGYEVAQRLRANSALRGVTLVALTGWGTAEDQQRAHSAGFDHHVTKPFEFAKLEQLLRGMAGRSGR